MWPLWCHPFQAPELGTWCVETISHEPDVYVPLSWRGTLYVNTSSWHMEWSHKTGKHCMAFTIVSVTSQYLLRHRTMYINLFKFEDYGLLLKCSLGILFPQAIPKQRLIQFNPRKHCSHHSNLRWTCDTMMYNKTVCLCTEFYWCPLSLSLIFFHSNFHVLKMVLNAKRLQYFLVSL